MFSHIDHHGEPLIPFGSYLGQNFTVQHPPHPNTVPQFGRLPVEIQLNIYRMCDPSTLFQLMQTSSGTRAEALKFFWSCPTLWYHTPSHWLLSSNGTSDPEPHCLDFARQIQQVEVSFDRLDWSFKVKYWSNTPRPILDMAKSKERTKSMDSEHQARAFWDALQANFPSARRVVLSDQMNRELPFSFPKELEIVVCACPENIDVSIATFEHEGVYLKYHKALYKLQRDAHPTWKLVHKPWRSIRILIPPKTIAGHSGTRLRLIRRGWVLNYEFWALRQMRTVAYENFHFSDTRNTPFICPHPDCAISFTQAGEWTFHAKETWHDVDEESWQEKTNRAFKYDLDQDLVLLKMESAFRACSTVPDAVEEILIKKEVMHRRAAQDHDDERKLYEADWGVIYESA